MRYALGVSTRTVDCYYLSLLLMLDLVKRMVLRTVMSGLNHNENWNCTIFILAFRFYGARHIRSIWYQLAPFVV